MGLLVACSAFITGCGDSGSQTHADPTIFQTETHTPENEIPLSHETSRLIEQNRPTPNPGAPSEDEASPSILNFTVIRVKLLPLAKIFPGDPYLKSADEFTIENENGLRIVLHEGSAIREYKGQRVFVDRIGMKLTLDDRKVDVPDQSIIDVIPQQASSSTWVWLALNQVRLTHAGLGVKARPSQLSFSGTFQIRPSVSDNKTSWSLIDTLDFESYVRSVVASEVPASFGLEALKAQSIAARTYALRQMAMVRCVGVAQGSCVPQAWDVDPSTAYQVYLGAKIQKPVVNKAVDSTKGQFLSSSGQPALTMFHASSGGETQSIGELSCAAVKDKPKCLKDRSTNYPYLVRAKDPFNGKWVRFGHGVGLPQQSAQGMAALGKNSQQILQQYYPGTQILNIENYGRNTSF